MKPPAKNTRKNKSQISRSLMLARLYIPFTALNTVRRHLNKSSKSILDLGCGNGQSMQYLNRSGALFSIGVDIWKPTLLEAKQQASHNGYVLCDIRNLPFESGSFDIVMSLEVLEHLDRESGINLLKEMERIARKQVIISTPLGDYKQGELEGNPHQIHLYMWKPGNLKEAGFKIKLMGLRNIGGENGLGSRIPGVFHRLADLMYVLAGPVVRIVPGWAGEMVCIKNLGKGSTH